MENIYSNPIALRVQGGTVQSNVHLCGACRHCIRRRSAMTGRTEERCSRLFRDPVIEGPVAECNQFVEVGKLALHEMADIAWIVEERGKHIGFLSPEDLQRRRGNGGEMPSTGVGFK